MACAGALPRRAPLPCRLRRLGLLARVRATVLGRITTRSKTGRLILVVIVLIAQFYVYVHRTGQGFARIDGVLQRRVARAREGQRTGKRHDLLRFSYLNAFPDLLPSVHGRTNRARLLDWRLHLEGKRYSSPASGDQRSHHFYSAASRSVPARSTSTPAARCGTARRS
jgi:hypothetical protein